ncbi:hypothetical protein DFH27DRAFT_539485, partial [Peziza echinospora]
MKELEGGKGKGKGRNVNGMGYSYSIRQVKLPKHILRRRPLDWSGVLGLAGLSGWDSRVGGGGGGPPLPPLSSPSSSSSSPQVVLKAVERMSTLLGEGMVWRVWNDGNENESGHGDGVGGSSVEVTYPNPNPTPTTPQGAVFSELQPQPINLKRKRGVVGGVHNDGFLEALPSCAGRAERRRVLMEMLAERDGSGSEDDGEDDCEDDGDEDGDGEGGDEESEQEEEEEESDKDSPPVM